MNIFTSFEFIVFLPLKLTIGSKATTYESKRFSFWF